FHTMTSAATSQELRSVFFAPFLSIQQTFSCPRQARRIVRAQLHTIIATFRPFDSFRLKLAIYNRLCDRSRAADSDPRVRRRGRVSRRFMVSRRLVVFSLVALIGLVCA